MPNCGDFCFFFIFKNFHLLFILPFSRSFLFSFIQVVLFFPKQDSKQYNIAQHSMSYAKWDIWLWSFHPHHHIYTSIHNYNHVGTNKFSWGIQYVLLFVFMDLHIFEFSNIIDFYSKKSWNFYEVIWTSIQYLCIGKMEMLMLRECPLIQGCAIFSY